MVDSYDAMTSRRNYRRNMTMEEAVEELNNCMDSQFDRECVLAFSEAIVNFTSTADAFSQEYLENFKIDQDN